MPTLSDTAIDIVKAVHKELEEKGEPADRYTMAKLLDTYPNIIVSALQNDEFEMGATTARKIIRAYIAYEQKKREQELIQIVRNQDKYKGTREIAGGNRKKLWGKEF